MCGVHIVYTKSLCCTSCHAFSPARGIVVEAIDHGTVALAVHQNRPAISILLVRLHPDTEQEHHAPIPAILQGCVEFDPGPLKERGRGNEEDKVQRNHTDDKSECSCSCRHDLKQIPCSLSLTKVLIILLCRSILSMNTSIISDFFLLGSSGHTRMTSMLHFDIPVPS
jgi:hypothetical protein